jgi:hypothetical protein
MTAEVSLVQQIDIFQNTEMPTAEPTGLPMTTM